MTFTGAWGAAFGVAMLLAIGPATPTEQARSMGDGQVGVRRGAFGKTGDGTPVEAFTLRNKAGVEVTAISYGAIVTSIRVPDRTGAMADVALGFDTLDGYLKDHPFFGAVVGRYGNRIGKASFTLDGKTYKLAANNGPNHLHGGVRGFDKYVWKAEVLAGVAGVAFTRTSPDGEEGYPGTVQVRVSYMLNDANELSIEYPRHHRQGDADQPDPAHLFQSRRSQRGTDRRSRADDRRRSVHAGGCDADPDRRARASGRHAARFPPAGADRGAHRRPASTNQVRHGLRPQLGDQSQR